MRDRSITPRSGWHQISHSQGVPEQNVAVSTDPKKIGAGGVASLNYKFDFSPVIVGLPNLLLGCLGTLGLALSGMVVAIVIGISGVVLRESRIKPLRWLVIGFVELVRN